MIKCFPPIVDINSQVLIIGTMPSVVSLDKQEYYAHPRNAFWKIIADLYNQGVEFRNFSEKKQCLLQSDIGLWDNLQYCEREGSLDIHIKNMIPNDFETLLKTYPKINLLLFNGQKSFQIFKRFHPALLLQYSYQIMPSTSPAHASLSFDEKLKLWQKALLQQNKKSSDG